MKNDILKDISENSIFDNKNIVTIIATTVLVGFLLYNAGYVIGKAIYYFKN